MNFHTDVPQDLHEALHLPGYYLDALKEWYPLGVFDFLSFDSYPNYFIASPLQTYKLGEITRNMTKAVDGALPVMCMESGYSVEASNNSMPEEDAFTPQNQANYLEQAVSELVTNGAVGFCLFGAWEQLGQVRYCVALS